MPFRLVNKDCWIALRRLTDRTGDTRTYMFCVTEQRGMICPRDRKSGKKPYELCPSCFEQMPEGAFIKEVVYPGILEPRGPPSDREPLTLQQIWDKGDEMDAKEKSKEDLRRPATHTQ